MTDNMGSKHRL